MKRLKVRSPQGDTEVAIGSGAWGAIRAICDRRRAVLLADRHVLAVHGERMAGALAGRLLAVVALPRGEAAKTPAVAAAAWARLARLGVRRDDLVVALGGGAALNLAGFVASTWMRGVPWIAVPTTLVGQADACIGGKTAVDLVAGKNLVGSFHPPQAALVDPRVLATLPERDYHAARFELLKCGWIGDGRLAALAVSPELGRREQGVIAEAVARSLRIKARLVGRDLRDRGDRRLLNLGHTFGHALEAALHFRRLRHGEAVGIGLLAALHVAARLGTLGEGDLDRRRRQVLVLRPPAVAASVLDRAASRAWLDKKRTGSGLAVVVPTASGAEVREPVSAALFREALAAAISELRVLPRK